MAHCIDLNYLKHEECLKCIVWYIYFVKSVVIDLKYKILLISNRLLLYIYIYYFGKLAATDPRL